MFKNYLRIQPKGIQLAVFLFIWSGFFLISSVAQPLIIKMHSGIDISGLNDFLEQDLYDHPGLLIFINALSSILIFFLPAFLFAYLAHPRPAAYLGMKAPEQRSQWPWVIVLALGMIPVLTTMGGWIGELDLGKSAKALQETREANIAAYLQATGPAALLLNIGCLALLPAVCEELFFRGIVQKLAYSFSNRHWFAVLVSAAAFALLHFSVYEFLPIFLAGLVLAWVYRVTGCIWWSILLHFLNNGLQVVIAYYAVRSPELKSLDNNAVFAAGIAFAGLVLFLLSLRRLYVLRTPLPDNWNVEEEKENNLF